MQKSRTASFSGAQSQLVSGARAPKAARHTALLLSSRNGILFGIPGRLLKKLSVLLCWTIPRTSGFCSDGTFLASPVFLPLSSSRGRGKISESLRHLPDFRHSELLGDDEKQEKLKDRLKQERQRDSPGKEKVSRLEWRAVLLNERFRCNSVDIPPCEFFEVYICPPIPGRRDSRLGASASSCPRFPFFSRAFKRSCWPLSSQIFSKERLLLRRVDSSRHDLPFSSSLARLQSSQSLRFHLLGGGDGTTRRSVKEQEGDEVSRHSSVRRAGASLLLPEKRSLRGCVYPLFRVFHLRPPPRLVSALPSGVLVNATSSMDQRETHKVRRRDAPTTSLQV
ncbi:hypothetical protein TGVAND_364210 [Toxoplasma gondii VAND]|uniref:Uncharacterized protein n=1 Tax=Toxoplasma gondii VAND TaxID=933077 RepID=A0A086Q298_TOXGO|nr:hypothetical protein TGVAND_364210 [Toxoplasma gondii VAND]